MSAGAFRSDARAARSLEREHVESPEVPHDGRHGSLPRDVGAVRGQPEDLQPVEQRARSPVIARARFDSTPARRVGFDPPATERVERVTNRAGHAVRVSRTHGPRDGRAREPHVRRAEVVRRHGKQHVRRARFLVMAQRHEHRARARNVGSLDARAFPRPEVVRDAPQVVGAQHRAAVRRREAPRFHRQRHRGHRRRERPPRGPNARKRRVGRGSRLHARRRAGDARRGPTASRGARRGSSEHVAPRSSADSRVSRRRASRNARTPRILSSRRRPKCWALSASEHEEATGRFCLHRTF